jgi:hypothetical protein
MTNYGMTDANLIFSDAQAETTAAAHDSTNIIDLGSIGEVAKGRNLKLVIAVNTAVTSDGSATVTFSLQSCATVGGSYTTHYSTPAIAKTALTQGALVLAMPLPEGLKRFVKVVYTIGTAALTAGKFDAFLQAAA